MSTELDQAAQLFDVAEDLISDASRYTAVGDPLVALDKLRQSSIVLFRAREQIERQTVLGLRALAERPLQDSFPRRVRDATIALCEAAETRDHMANHGDPGRAARWTRRVDRARGRVLQVVREELGRGGQR